MAENKRTYGATWADASIRGMELFSESVNKGWIFPFFAFLILALLIILAVRLPPENLGHVTVAIVDGLSGKLGFAVILLLNNILWVIVHYKSKKLYDDEIKRLTDERKGIITGEIQTTLKNRQSSQDASETLLYPSAPENDDETG